MKSFIEFLKEVYQPKTLVDSVLKNMQLSDKVKYKQIMNHPNYEKIREIAFDLWQSPQYKGTEDKEIIKAIWSQALFTIYQSEYTKTDIEKLKYWQTTK